LLYVFNLGLYQIRADIDGRQAESEAFRRFDSAAKHFAESGGGLISTMYHPTEMVHTEFWDAVNFAHGEVRPRQRWVLPRRRSKDDAEHSFRILKDYVPCERVSRPSIKTPHSVDRAVPSRIHQSGPHDSVQRVWRAA